MAKPDLGREMMAALQATSCIRRFPTTVLASDKIVPVVLEFQQTPVAVYKRQNPDATEAEINRYQRSLIQIHKDFLASLTALGIGVLVGSSTAIVAGPRGTSRMEVQHDFTYVFNGLGC